MEKTQIKNTPKQYHALAVITAMLGETNLGGETAKTLATRRYRELPEFKELKEGICFKNHIGDGLYPVSAKFSEDGQIVELKVSFDV